MNILFEWDEAKSRTNLRKHGVTFEDASRIFEDPLRAPILDRIVDGEERWLTIGMFEGIVLLAVAHTVRDEWTEDGPVEVIRIISARKVTPKEREAYEENR